MQLHSHDEFVCDIGTLLGGNEGTELKEPRIATRQGKSFRLSQDQWSTHCAIIGPTGQGKSRLIWQMLREHRRQRRGFCLIDVGDLAKDFLADCAAEVLLHGNHALLSKLHYVRLGYERLPRYDALKFRPPEQLHPELQQGAFVCWRHTRVKELMRVCQANTTGSVDFLNQPRAQRVLSNVFTALATEVDRKRLAFEDVFIFFDPTHPFHKRALDRVAMLLPSEIRRELEMIGGFKRMQDLRQEIESSENRLRMVLGPCMKAMLSATGTEACLDLEKVIDQGGYLIVDAQQSRFVSHEENVALASLVALDYVETNLNRPRQKRRFSTLFVDETPELLAPLGREIGRWLRILRKYGVACCLSFQDLQSLKREDFDLAPTVLAQCGTIIAFRTRWPSDTEVLSRVLLTGNLDFTPLIHEVERHAGHQFLRIDEVSETVKQDVGNSTTDAEATTNATSQGRSEGESRQANNSQGATKSVTSGAHGARLTSAEGNSTGLSTGLGRSTGLTHGTTHTSGTTHSRTHNETNGWAVSVKHGIVPLPIIVREAQATGKLQTSFQDQQAQQQQLLHGLDQRHAIILTSGMKKAAEIVTTEVNDPFESAAAQAKGVEWIVRELQERHAYFFTPSFDPTDQQRRLEQTLKEDPSDEIEKELSTESPSPGHGVRTKLDAPAGKEIPFPE